MEYLDTQRRDRQEAFGTWLSRAVNGEAARVRWQSGYFNSEPLGLIQSELQRVSAGRGVVALVGSNDGVTTTQSLEDLVEILGLPQPNSKVGVVQLENGIFHPKTFHIERTDGSQTAYVGSANLTGSGVSLHIEAGVVMDSRLGDSENILTRVGGAVEEWFDEDRPGLHLVSGFDDLQALRNDGIIGTERPPKPPRRVPDAGRAQRAAGAPLRRLLTIPRLQRRRAVRAAPIRGAIAGLAIVGYPADVLFAPGAVGPSHGADALTGVRLPHQSAGLVVRLTRDSTKRFDHRPGTSYISLPNECLASVAFGFGGNDLPRAEFEFRARYISATGDLRAGATVTNITYQGVGPTPGRTHRNLRVLVPAAVGELGADISRNGLHVPQPGDLALLEFPSPDDPIVRVTFSDPASRLHGQLAGIMDAAIAVGDAVGQGSAAWASPTVVPAW